MTFAEFQATGIDVSDLSKFPHFAAQDVSGPGRAYLDYGLFIQSDVFTDGVRRWFVTISNGGKASADLAECERELFEFAVTEGYIDGPTTVTARIGSLAEFQATGIAVADLSVLPHMNAQGLEGPGRVYCGDDGFFIEGTAESGYCLTIENDSGMGALPALEAKLYQWAEDQGYLP